MLGAIYIGLSGMNAYSKGLQTISNNVANMNTSGYKSTSVSFTDVFNSGGAGSSYIGSNASQLGNGVRYADPSIDFGQGDLRQTDGDLDLALQGNGLLVLLDGDKTYFTRTGHFVVNEDGYIVEEGSGFKLAVLDATNQPVALSIDNKRTSEPVATTKITFADNLSADWSATSPVVVNNIAVYDSAGGKHVWKVTFTHASSGVVGEWSVQASDDAGNIGAAATLSFVSGTPNPSTLTINSTPVGADPLSVVLDFSQNVTSFSFGSTSTLRAAKVDGNGAGTLVGATIDTDGQVKLTYSNDKSEELGYVAVADFRDPQALERIGAGLFENKGGGEYRLLASGTYGVGKLVAGQMEASNVDLSKEFGDLILIQRGFQASSQVVSVSNDMIQQLFGIRGQG